MDWTTALLSLLAGLSVAVVTAPVGVSGAVFLLPVQLSLLGVPSPAVTPTNLLYNVVAGPGALLRYRRRHGSLFGPLTRLLLLGTLPGVAVGAVVRVFAVPGPDEFRLIVAVLLLPVGAWLCLRALRPAPAAKERPPPAAKERPPPAAKERPASAAKERPPSDGAITSLALAVGVVGGIYGIGGGSLLGPILVGRGMPVTTVAPAALASTFVTSIAGAATYGLLALTTSGDIAPHWPVGLLCGLGGLVGGYLGAHLQPRLPETWLRFLLGALAVILAVVYAAQAVPKLF